uniref:LacI family DNA-binding transcriptional regulator n=1 Tax=Nocardioides terrisoli TaxID=3388267 RepID=UPI0037C69BE7
MSGSTSVNAEMTERVREAAAQLGYRPNSAARGLASGVLRNVGVLMPDMTNPYFSNVLQTVSQQAEKQDYRLVVADSRQRLDQELSICLGLAAQTDALLLLAPRMPAADLKTLARREMPVVIVNRVELGVDLPMIAVDNFSAMLEICTNLAQLGHRRAVYLAGPRESWQNQERWRAVQQARIFGLEATLVQTDGTLESGFHSIEEALKTDPTALIGFNDLVAVGAISALRRKALAVPRDLSVTGFDDSALGRYTEPRLTTAKSPMLQLGDEAWRLVWTALEGERPENPPLLPAEVVLGQSTGPRPNGKRSL